MPETGYSLAFSTFVTIGIILIVIVVFFLHRYILRKKQYTIKNKTVIASFVMLMLIIAVAIGAILHLWGYDISDWFLNLGMNFTSILEENIPRLVGSLIALFIALMILKIAKISLLRVGGKESPTERRKQTIAKIILSVTRYIIMAGTVLIVLSIWGMNVGPALAGLGIFGLVIGLGAQKFINDLISGFFIIFERHFDVGDWVEIQGFMGEVVDIGLKTTKVRNIRGEIKIFNNGSVDPVSNFSVSESLAVADFSIAYKEDVAKTIELLREKLPALHSEREEFLEDPRVLGVMNLNDSGVDIRVVSRVQTMTQWGAERALRQRIKEILDTNGIEIPFPQLTLHYAKEKKKSE